MKSAAQPPGVKADLMIWRFMNRRKEVQDAVPRHSFRNSVPAQLLHLMGFGGNPQ
jgi:hypothetical protein